MFDLDHAIRQWRRQMANDGVRRPEALDELESHLREEIEAIGFKVTPSVGNFLLVHFPPGKAPQADEFLLARGLILRRMEAYHLPDALRASVGSEEANGALIAALSEFAKSRKASHG